MPERPALKRLPPILVSLVAMLWSAACAGAQTGPTTIPSRIVEAMQANEAALDPITISWTYKNISEAPTTQAATAKLQVNAGFFDVRENRMYWQKGKIFARVITPNQNVNEVSFDGRISYLGNAYTRGSTELSKRLNSEIAKSDKPTERRTWLNDDYFTQIGLRALSTSKEMETGRAQPEALALIDHGAAVVSVDEIQRNSTPVVRIHLRGENPPRAFADRTDRKGLSNITAGMSPAGQKRFVELWEAEKLLPLKRDYIFYFDPGKNYAVVGREERYGDRKISETSSDGFQQVSGRRVWLPARSIEINYAAPNNPTILSDTPLWRHEIELKELKTDPVPEAQFVLDYKTPGTHVMDNTVPGQPVNYTVRANAAGASMGGPPPGSEPLANSAPVATPTKRWTGMLWGMAVAAVVAAALVIWVRKRPAR